MLVIKIELWPHGDKSKAESIAAATIHNDGTGTRTTGNYVINIFRKGTTTVFKTGSLSGFKRLRKGPWELLMFCLGSIYLREPEDTEYVPAREEAEGAEA